MLHIESFPVEYQLGVHADPSARTVFVLRLKQEDEEVRVEMVEDDASENPTANKPATDVEKCPICALGDEDCDPCRTRVG